MCAIITSRLVGIPSRNFSRPRAANVLITSPARDSGGARYCSQFVHNVLNSCEFAPTINSRRQMAGSPPNLHTIDSRSACIHGVLKVKVKFRGHVIRALLCWQQNRFFHANDRIKASSLQSNIFSISVTFAGWKHHCGRLPCYSIVRQRYFSITI